MGYFISDGVINRLLMLADQLEEELDRSPWAGPVRNHPGYRMLAACIQELRAEISKPKKTEDKPASTSTMDERAPKNGLCGRIVTTINPPYSMPCKREPNHEGGCNPF